MDKACTACISRNQDTQLLFLTINDWLARFPSLIHSSCVWYQGGSRWAPHLSKSCQVLILYWFFLWTLQNQEFIDLICSTRRLGYALILLLFHVSYGKFVIYTTPLGWDRMADLASTRVCLILMHDAFVDIGTYPIDIQTKSALAPLLHRNHPLPRHAIYPGSSATPRWDRKVLLSGWLGSVAVARAPSRRRSRKSLCSVARSTCTDWTGTTSALD